MTSSDNYMNTILNLIASMRESQEEKPEPIPDPEDDLLNTMHQIHLVIETMAGVRKRFITEVGVSENVADMIILNLMAKAAAG